MVEQLMAIRQHPVKLTRFVVNLFNFDLLALLLKR
jgi:hypothetical protein